MPIIESAKGDIFASSQILSSDPLPQTCLTAADWPGWHCAQAARPAGRLEGLNLPLRTPPRNVRWREPGHLADLTASVCPPQTSQVSFRQYETQADLTEMGALPAATWSQPWRL